MADMIGLIQLLYEKLYNDTELREVKEAMEELLITKTDIIKAEFQKKKAQEIALNLIKIGLSNDKIAEATTLSLADIQALTEQPQN